MALVFRASSGLVSDLLSLTGYSIPSPIVHVLHASPSNFLHFFFSSRASIRCGTGLFVTDDLLKPGASMVSLVSLAHSLAGLAMKHGRALTVQTSAPGVIRGRNRPTRLVAAVPIIVNSPPDSEALPLQIGALLVGAESGPLSDDFVDAIKHLATSIAPAMMTIAFPTVSRLTYLLHLRDHDASYMEEEDLQDLPLDVARPMGTAAMLQQVHHRSTEGDRGVMGETPDRQGKNREENVRVRKGIGKDPLFEARGGTERLESQRHNGDMGMESEISLAGSTAIGTETLNAALHNALQRKGGLEPLPAEGPSLAEPSVQLTAASSHAERKIERKARRGIETKSGRSQASRIASIWAAPLWCLSIVLLQSWTVFLPSLLLSTLVLLYFFSRPSSRDTAIVDSVTGVIIVIGIVIWVLAHWIGTQVVCVDGSEDWSLYASASCSTVLSMAFSWFAHRALMQP